MSRLLSCLFFFFFNDTATTEIYTLSLHDALPISAGCATIQVAATLGVPVGVAADFMVPDLPAAAEIILDRKSTRLNSSHLVISYAVFCLKKKKKKNLSYTVDKSSECTYTDSHIDV